MCGRWGGRRSDKQRIAEWMQAHDTNVFDDSLLAPSYNVAPQKFSAGGPARSRNRRGEELAVMRWGADSLLVERREGRLLDHQCKGRNDHYQPDVIVEAMKRAAVVSFPAPTSFTSGRRSTRKTKAVSPLRSP